MDIEIILLDKSHIPKVISLIAGYLNSSSNGVDESDPSPDQLEQCEQILNRFINDSSAYCYLAKQEHEYIGFIILSWSFSISKGSPVLRIEALYSSSKHRKKGVGRKLMEHAIDLAISNKAARLQLETDDDNAPARTLYKQLGFKMLEGKGVYMSFL
ncbi:GNAT family N-acetyltransferase [Paenibacillus sp. ACRRX]|uniref:GNAT family N-acetyltransferase n=1 Tax=unclassified Paenibacillus TaxID=185978 RepID=UPI001EF5757C|nr:MULTISPECIES: GNAT family N-acetyltransferase [unclassified Paenibacillus]MCG7409399.1 GNAT family N-acetyltransferase [Paenibacillus sp. ACRRX]MDK8180059.1 GNAT family N-acetyltransferase [Paenibacillus sp. UMB4589-SE434]